jgi:hypothetical protein
MVICSKFPAPQIEVHADGAEIKRGDPRVFDPNFIIPAMKPPEIQIG